MRNGDAGVNPYVQNAINYKNLFFQLAGSQIKLKYQRSYLGMLWSLLNPLLMMVVLTAVFSTIFRNSIENFPVYLLCGRLVYEFHADCTKNALDSIICNAPLIKKIYVPKYAFPIANSLASLVNLLFSLIALVIVMLVLRVEIYWTVLLIPLPILYSFVFSTGLGLILSAVNVFFRDIKHLYSVALTMWMYVTPLFYPVSSISNTVILRIIEINPLYQFIKIFRGLVMYGQLPDITTNLICAAWSLSMLALGLLIFKKTQDKFILYI